MSFKSDIRLQRNVILIGILLMLIKMVAYFITHSNAILTDALESLVNIFAGTFSLYSLYLASQPSDHNHPYGHGKVEFIAGVIEGFLIIVAGFLMSIKAVYNFIHPEIISHIDIGLVLALVAGLINYVMGVLMTKHGKEKHSMSMQSEGTHLKSDGYTSFAMVIGLAIMWITNLYWLDNAITVLMAIFIGYLGYSIVRKSIAGIMDETDLDVNARVFGAIKNQRKPEWIDFHEFRVIRYGRKLHVDCHLVLPFYLTIKDEQVEVIQIQQLISEGSQQETEIFIHTDPCTENYCKHCTMPNCDFRQEDFIAKKSGGF